MTLSIQNGNFILRSGGIGTGTGCCCRDCSGPCDAENPCPPGCDCVNGQCVACVVPLSFTASCFGSGAAGFVTLDSNGSVASATLTSGGSGYAILGRVAPTLTVTGGVGTGATFTPTLTQTTQKIGSCEVSAWQLSSVSVSGVTSDYTQGNELTITAAEGDTQLAAAGAFVNTKHEPPTLSIGGDADLTLTYTDNLDGTWSVDSVAVNDGGTVYTDDQQLTVTLGADDVEESAATLIATTGRIEPTVVAYFPFSSGTGAVLALTLTQTTDGGGKDIWETSSLTITAAGTGYAVNDTIYGSVTDGQVATADLVAVVSSVDGSGAVTGVTITQAGTYFKSDGIIQSVAVFAGGRYYKETGEIDSVTVYATGSYYREDTSAPPVVSPVSAKINLDYRKGGSPASFSVTVESNTSDNDFGEVSKVSVVSPGSEYLFCCGSCDDKTDCNQGCNCVSNTCETPLCYRACDAETPCNAGCICCNGECCDGTCCDGECIQSCIPECSVICSATEQNDDYLKASYVAGYGTDISNPFAGAPQYDSEWLQQYGGCPLVWIFDQVSQGVNTRLVLGSCTYAKTWLRFRLFRINCEEQTLEDVTDQALTEPFDAEVCTIGAQFCSFDDCALNVGANPGYLTCTPTLSCP